MNIENNILRNLFRNVYFINGTAYAGKSTMVKLLADKYNGICCGENYHMDLLKYADPSHQPNLCYFQTMSGWQEFVSRTPEAYAAWIDGCSREAAQLELIVLLRLAESGKKIFVDTNIPLDTLKEISNYHHVAIMLSPQSFSVDRFFDRPDAEKQFIYKELLKHPDPAWAIGNYRKSLEKINSAENYAAFVQSGFFTHIRDKNTTIEETLIKLEKHFGLI